MSRLILILVLFLATLAGCTVLREYFPETDTGEPPMELVDIAHEITIEVLWSAKVGKGVKDRYLRLSPSVVDGKVVAADYKGQVSAFNAFNGEPLWKTKLDLPVSAGPGAGEDLILIGTKDAAVVALDATSGSVIWKTSVSSAVLAAPRIADGVVVVRSVDGQIYGLDANDGSRLWVYQRNVPVLTLHGMAAPVITGRKVILGLASGKLVALSLKDGQLLWDRTIVVPRGRTELDRLVDIVSEPVVDGGYLYAVTYNGRIAAVWLEDGDVLWTRDMSSHAGLRVEGKSVYVTDAEGYIWALDSRTGASLWRQSKLLRRKVTAPIPYKDYVVAGDFAGYVHWMDKEDGHFVGRIQVGDEEIINAPQVIDDILYVSGKGGVLKAIKVSG
jgi:outer membrane protein assembly factor BamB